MNIEEVTGILNDSEQLAHLGDTYSGLSGEERKRLVIILKDIRDERAGRALTLIYETEKDKEVRKLIKKHLFRLKTMGVKVEDLRSPGEPVLRTIEEKRYHMGFMSNYDRDGIRVIVAALEVKRGYYLFINAEIHFVDGLIDLKLAPLSKQELEGIIAEYRAGTGRSHVFIEVPPPYAACLIEESDAVSRRYAEDVKQLTLFASTLKGEVRKPGDIYSLEIPEGTESVPVDVLLSDEIFEPFSFTWDTVEEDRKALDSITAPTILVPPHMMQEKMESFLKDLLDRDALKLYIPRMKRLLEDYAYIFYLSQRFDRFKALRELLTEEKGLYAVLVFFAGQTLQAKKPTSDDPPPSLIINPHDQIRR